MSFNDMLGKVYACEALDLLQRLPSQSIDAVISDPMYMVSATKQNSCTYDWGIEPGTGHAHEFWEYHCDIYQECRRVLKPGGVLAWAVGLKHKRHFRKWFGGHRLWSLLRWKDGAAGGPPFHNAWIVQSKEQTPIRQPDVDPYVMMRLQGWWHYLPERHPCPKTEAEMRFLVRHLTQPGQICLDVFAGTGTTLVACERLRRRWIGCDRSKLYADIAAKRIFESRWKRRSKVG